MTGYTRPPEPLLLDHLGTRLPMAPKLSEEIVFAPSRSPSERLPTAAATSSEALALELLVPLTPRQTLKSHTTSPATRAPGGSAQQSIAADRPTRS